MVNVVEELRRIDRKRRRAPVSASTVVHIALLAWAMVSIVLIIAGGR